MIFGAARRRAWALLAVGCMVAATALALAPAYALAQDSRNVGAEQFVEAQAERAIAVLDDKSQTAPARLAAFRALVDQIADEPRITTFVLGKYARTITPAQQAQFTPIFREYLQNIYEAQLSNFHGQKVRVTGSVVRRPGDVVVNTEIYGGDQKQPLAVAWRVLGEDGAWKVIDVQASGIWLGITEQQDFVSTIDNHGGDIDALIAQLKAQIQQKQASRGR
jgi:phospholipid transport system substrate-binding protein